MSAVEQIRLYRAFSHDERIVAARLHYRAHIRAGMPEHAAWMLYRAVQERVKAQLRARIDNGQG